MDGIGRAIGAGVPLQLGDKTYLLGRVDARTIGELEQFMLSKRTSPVDVALKRISTLEAAGVAVSPDSKKMLLDNALEKEASGLNFITRDEFESWLDTREGITYSIWLLIRQNHPDVSLKEINEQTVKASQDQLAAIIAAREQVAGTDNLGNETGLTTTEATEKTTMDLMDSLSPPLF